MKKTTYKYGLKLLLIQAMIIFMNSCEEKINWEQNTSASGKLVVESMLTNENKRQWVKLSYPVATINQEVLGATGATVWVTSEGDSAEFLESDSIAGLYITANKVAATIDRVYTLHIELDGERFEAETYMEPLAPPSQPTFQYVPDTGLYQINWNNPQYSPFEQAMYEAMISWEHLLPAGQEDSVARARLLYYTFNTLDVSYNIFPQDAEEVYFPIGSIAILKKYSLIEGYAAYLRALLAETEWQGSLFEDARGNLPSNISNGGLGYFSACSVAVDTVVVE